MSLADELRKVIEFDEKAATEWANAEPCIFGPDLVDGAKWQSARLRPVLLAMVDVIEAAELEAAACSIVVDEALTRLRQAVEVCK